MLLGGFLSGVALRSIVSIPNIFLTAFFVASIISFVFLSDRYSRSILLCALGIAAGVFRFSIAEHYFQNTLQSMTSEKKVELTGVIDEIPVISDSTVSARTRIDQGYVLVRLDRGSAVAYGDRIVFKGVCELPDTFETNTGTTFDYPHYLMARGIHHVCKVSSYEILEKHQGNYIQEKLYQLRLWFSFHIDQAFKNPHAGLIKGVLLGDKSGLSQDLKQDMTVAGVIHIAVLSGSNIAMVAAIIFGLCKSFPYRIRIIVSVIIVVLFILLSGADPPAVRAGILVLIIFLGKYLHRAPDTGRALLLIGFIMVCYNPFALIYDMSFQLSFLATIGIVHVAPLMEKVCHRVTEKCGLREVLSGTLGAQAVVTPLILYATGAFSIVSLPANVLIGWAVPVLMALGFFGGALHIISGFIAAPIVFLAECMSHYIVSITKISAHLPYAQILLPLHYPILLPIMYVILFVILKRLRIALRKASS